jgi:Tol biopolymer transport system component
MSYDHKLVRHDTNNDADIFVRDRSTGTTKRVSVGSHGRQSNGRSEWADISASGRFVAFESRGSNLASGDRNKRYDVFVRDLKRNRTTLAGIAPNGIHGGATPSLSADGRFVAFGGLDKNGATGQIFVRDLKEHSTQRVTVSMAGGRPDGGSFAPSISGNGRLVAFSSGADDLVAGDTNGAVDIFVRDLKTHETEMVSVSPPPHEEGGFSDGASISADGRYVAFQSSFDPNTGNPSGGVFRRDLETKTTERISVGEGGEPENAASFAPAISASGRYVAFTSFASNLVPGDTNEQSGVAVRDIFVRDAVTKTTTRVSVSSSGEQSNSQSQAAAISGDGRFAAFQSQATNLDGDTKGKWNIFVRGPLRP